MIAGYARFARGRQTFFFQILRCSLMLILSVVLIALGCVLLVLSNRSRTKANAMAGTETSRIGELLELVKAVRSDLGAGESSGYSEYCELKGEIVCNAAVTGEFSGQQLAMVETRVTRVYETRREERDDQGHVRTTWSKGSDTLSQNTQTAEFFIDDGSGKVRVRPPAKGVELLELVDRFEPPTAVETRSGQLSLGNGAFELSIPTFRSGSSRRLLGYKFTEKGLPIGRRAYALGHITDTEEGLVMHDNDAPEKPFILSLRSEEELVASSERNAKWLRFGGYVAALLGVALAVYSVVN